MKKIYTLFTLIFLSTTFVYAEEVSATMTSSATINSPSKAPPLMNAPTGDVKLSNEQMIKLNASRPNTPAKASPAPFGTSTKQNVTVATSSSSVVTPVAEVKVSFYTRVIIFFRSLFGLN